MKARHLWIGVTAAAILAVVALWVLGVGRRPQQSVRPPAPGPQSTLDTPDRLVSPVDAGPPNPHDPRTVVQDSTDDKNGPAQPSDQGPVRWYLRGDLLGGGASSILVEALPAGGTGPYRRVRQVVDPGSSNYQIDVSSLSKHLDREGAELEVWGRMEGAPSVLVKVGASASFPADIGGGPARVIQADLTFDFDHGMRTTVVLENGAPAVDATVAALRVDSTTQRAAVVAQTKTNGDGEFSLRLNDLEDIYVVVYRDELRPTTVTAIQLPGLQSLVLRAGESIAGRAYGVDDIEPQLVTLSARSSGILVTIDRTHFVMVDGEFEYGSMRAEVSAAEDFRFSGLAAAKYGLYCSPAENHCSAPGASGNSVIVTAPQTGVRLRNDTARIRLLPEDADGNRITRFEATVSVDNDSWALPCGGDAHALMLLPERTDVSVRLEKEGYEGQTLRLRTPGRGAVLVERPLMEKLPVGSIRVALTNQQSEPIAEASFGFRSIQQMEHLEKTHHDRQPDGVYLIPQVPEGDYQIEVRPGGPWDHAISLYVPGFFSASVARDSESTAAVQLETGGRLRVKISDKDGHTLAAHCAIADIDGAPLPVTYRELDDGRRVVYRDPLIPHHFLDSPETLADVIPAFEPGRYKASITHAGYEPVETEFVVTRGEVTELRVTLEPNP